MHTGKSQYLNQRRATDIKSAARFIYSHAEHAVYDIIYERNPKRAGGLYKQYSRYLVFSLLKNDCDCNMVISRSRVIPE
jgi:hypothetical protein